MVNAALAILFPLYIYPLNCGTKSTCAWLPLFNAIEANPTLQFTAVINPFNGPGNTTYPVPEYIGGISTLNGYANVRTIGYVASEQGTRPATGASGYQADINAYANWATYTAADISMHGIFVDQMNSSSSSTNEQFYSNLSSGIKSAFPDTSRQFTVFNPGVPVVQDFFVLADIIVTFENFYSNEFAPFTIFTDPVYASTPRNQQAALFHDFNGSTADQQNLTDTMRNTEHMAFVYVTTQPDYNNFSTLLAQFVTAVAATNAE